MTNAPPPGPLLVTGASGTVGDALLRALPATWSGRVLALGRTRPEAGVSRARFWPVDLADASAVTSLAARLATGPPVSGLVCVAGLDSRSGLCDFTPSAAAECMQVNAWAHVQLLHAALTSRIGTEAAGALPVVLISSDVTGTAVPGTLVYAAAKAAAEEAFRHATADVSAPGMALLIVRLPDIGIAMRSAAPGPPPPPRDGALARPVLGAAITAISSFLNTRQQTLEVWNA
jgi:NAD(P)-dependent dehydrogenase (short-subunit alcohol dehydrogenase family)